MKRCLNERWPLTDDQRNRSPPTTVHDRPMTIANKTSPRTTCTNQIWPHTNGFNIWNAPIKQLQIDPKKSPTTTPLYTTKHAAVAVVVLAVCLVFLLERTHPFLKPPREILFRVGNYFVTDDEKATIKTVVGDEKVPTVIFSSGILQPVAQAPEPTYDHDRVTPLMLFWNAVVLTEWPIGHWSEISKPWQRKLERFATMFYMLLQKFATVLLHKIKYMQRLHTDGTAVFISSAKNAFKRFGGGESAPKSFEL